MLFVISSLGGKISQNFHFVIRKNYL